VTSNVAVIVTTLFPAREFITIDGMAQGSSNKKIANSLVAMSSAAVLAVYTAGYVRTRSAAGQLEAQAAERRPAPPVPQRTAPPIAEPLPAAPVIEPPAVVAKPRQIAATEPGPEPEPAPVPSTPAPAETPAPVTVAAPPPEPPPPPVEHKPETAPAPAAPVWKDGTYLGWGTSRHGDIQASVVIEGGRIASATIAQCWTRYSCSVIANLPPQVAQRQSPEVDFVSGATQSANAFYYGVVDALSKAK
jgi:uncharacterized protein with FMN-binding domain